MTIIYNNGVYDENVDVLVRVYPNQSRHPKDLEAFCGEVLFKPHMNREHERFTAQFPRGIAYACVEVVNTLGNEILILISNELPDTVGHLTSCDKHFDIRFKEKLTHE